MKSSTIDMKKLALKAGVPLEKIERGMITAEEWNRIANIANTIETDEATE